MKNAPTLALGLICILLAAGLATSIAVLNQKDQTIANLENTITKLL